VPEDYVINTNKVMM